MEYSEAEARLNRLIGEILCGPKGAMESFTMLVGLASLIDGAVESCRQELQFTEEVVQEITKRFDYSLVAIKKRLNDIGVEI